MKVKEAMTGHPEIVRPDTTVQEAARLMCDRGVGVLVVQDEEGQLGIVTDRDITVRATAQGLNPQMSYVQSCMTPAPATCLEDEELEVAMELMKELQVRRLPVHDSRNGVAGILSLGDVAQNAEDAVSGQVLRRICHSP